MGKNIAAVLGMDQHLSSTPNADPHASKSVTPGKKIVDDEEMDEDEMNEEMPEFYEYRGKSVAPSRSSQRNEEELDALDRRADRLEANTKGKKKANEVRVSDSIPASAINDLAPGSYLHDKSPDEAVMQDDSGSAESELNPFAMFSGFLANAVITGGTITRIPGNYKLILANDPAPGPSPEENHDKTPDVVMQDDSESERSPLTLHSDLDLFGNAGNFSFKTRGTFAANASERQAEIPVAPNFGPFFIHPILSQSKLDEPNQEVDQSSGIIATQVLIAAEDALKHVRDSRREAKIKAAFLDLQIVESQYIVLAGFNEALIQSRFGYLEEVHIFCSVELPNSPLLLIRLGEILSPYPGIIFTPSSGYKTPVFKDDGTVWDYDDLCLDRTKAHSNIHIKEMLLSKLNTFNTTGGQPSIYATASGCPEGGNDDHGGAGEDEGNSHSDGNNPDHSNDPDDPDDPEGAGNGDSLTSGISFAAQAKLFKGTSNSSSFKPFQELEINGTVVAQTTPGQLKPKRSQFKSHVEFSKLKFQSVKSAGSLAYQQVYVGVEINSNDEKTETDVLQPLQTPAFDQETKEIMANKVATSGSGALSIGLLNPTPTMSLLGNRSKEAFSSTEVKKYHSRITEGSSGGVAWWGFSVDDVNERQTGIRFGTHRAHPSVDFKFWSDSAKKHEPPPPPPKYFDILVTSCWSLISGNEGYTTSGWFSLFKGLDTGTATLYSNLCHAVRLEVPSHLSQETFHTSVSEVNQLGSKTVVTLPGLYKIIPTVSVLAGRPFESGNSYGPSLRPQ